jgi:ADP-ribosyl-[dinitrogen reductase] hydrolase
MEVMSSMDDRAAGVLLGLACGDVLGVPYEFDSIRLGDDERPAMLGGGIAGFAPGEWSDDTSMAVAVAEGLHTGRDLDSRLDAVARRFLDWYRTSPPDVGIQTRAILTAASAGEARDAGASMHTEAARYAATHPHAAGNGGLMRTAPIALAHLDDRAGCAATARAVAALTHADPHVADSCVLWTEAVRLAVTDGGIDLAAGLDLVADPHRWLTILDEARSGDLARFHPNGWTVRTLQVAYGAIIRADADLEEALAVAIRVGDDTDSVAAVAGSLLGAHHGASALPTEWLTAIHGWPGYTEVDLRRAASDLAR